MIYAALLRGVNVGGNSRVEMPRLKQLFEALGFGRVVTYINSGNVVFVSKEDSVSKLSTQIEAAIDREFGFKVAVVVIGLDDLSNINKSIPSMWENNGETKTDVMFLRDDVNNPNIINEISVNPNIETLKYCDGALVWNIHRDNLSKSRVQKSISKELYTRITARNVNTLRKLIQIMEQI